jgi:predicted MFS family arabinose efflux permease
MLTFGTLLLLGGRIADVIGRRRMLLAGVGLFTLASFACGLASSTAVLIGARAIQGVGAAAMTPAALSILMRTFPEGAERNKAIGAWGAAGGIGATAAWIIGGPLIDGPGWAWVFWINVPIGIASIGIATLEGVAGTDAGLASGLNNTFENIGGALGTAIMGTIAATRTTDLLHTGSHQLFALNDGLQLAFAVAITFPILGLLATAFIRRAQAPVSLTSLELATVALETGTE